MVLHLLFGAASQRFALPALGRGRRSHPARKMKRRRKLPEMCAESPASGARFVSPLFILEETVLKKYSNTLVVGMRLSEITAYRVCQRWYLPKPDAN
jgi:hypothetical protein